VIRALMPVESILVEGELVGERAGVDGPGRVSGIRRGNDLVLLVADYRGVCRGSVKLNLDISVRSEIRDLMADAVFTASVATGKQKMDVPLEGSRASLFHVRPL
jgi:hypothetical protein